MRGTNLLSGIYMYAHCISDANFIPSQMHILVLVFSLQAAKLNLTYPRYAWLTFGWYPFGWWLSDGTVDCTDQQLAAFMERSLALQIFPNPDDRSASTDTGLVRM